MMSELKFLPLNIKILGHQNRLVNKLILLHPDASVLLAKTNKSSISNQASPRRPLEAAPTGSKATDGQRLASFPGSAVPVVSHVKLDYLKCTAILAREQTEL